MKSNSTLKLLINPFTRFAGWQAFVIGLVLVLLSGGIGGMNRVWFDGVLDMHIGGKGPAWLGLVMLGIDLVSIVLVMSVAAIILAKKFRFIDILGTMTLARGPMLLLSIAGLFIDVSVYDVPGGRMPTSSLIIMSILSTIMIIWHITLIYNALRVSANLKGAKLATTVIIGILAAEILSKLLIQVTVASCFN